MKIQCAGKSVVLAASIHPNENYTYVWRSQHVSQSGQVEESRAHEEIIIGAKWTSSLSCFQALPTRCWLGLWLGHNDGCLQSVACDQ